MKAWLIGLVTLCACLLPGVESSALAATAWVPGVQDVAGTSADAGNAVVAMNRRGDSAAAWRAGGSQGSIIQVSTRAAGGAWSAPITLASYGGLNDAPAVAIDDAGDVVAAWNGGDGAHAAVRPAGGSFAAVHDLEAGPGSGLPRVALDRLTGDAEVAWVGASGLEYASYAATGRVWSSARLLDANGWAPALQVNASGGVLIGYQIVSGGNNTVAAASGTLGGVLLGARVSAATENASLGDVSAALDDSGESVVVWTGTGTMPAVGNVVRAVRRGVLGDFSAPSDIGPSGYQPQVAIDDQGQATAIWVAAGNSIHTSTSTSTLTGWRAQAPIGSTGSADMPEIAAASDGSTIAIWETYNGSHTVIQAAARIGGTTFGAPVTLDETTDDSFEPQIAIDAHGDGVGIWRHQNFGPASNFLIHTAGYDAVGADIGGPRSATAGQSLAYSIAPLNVFSNVTATSWDFGDGTMPTSGSAVTHTYAAPGTYLVTATSTDALGNANGTRTTVTVSPPQPPAPPPAQPTAPPPTPRGPTATFQMLTGTPRVGYPVVLRAPLSPGDAPITQISWDFGDGAKRTLAGATLQAATTPFGGVEQTGIDHVYLAPGAHPITMAVTDGNGRSASSTQTVNVIGKPRADIQKVTPTKPRAGRPITFTAAGSTAPGAKIVQYAWKFGSGKAGQYDKIVPGKPGGSASPEVSWTFAKKGVYPVSVWITTSDGAKASAGLTVTVSQAHFFPTAKLSFAPAAVVAGQPVIFDTAGSHSDPLGTAASIPFVGQPGSGLPTGIAHKVLHGFLRWNDGTPQTRIDAGQSYAHIFHSPGSYPVQLQVTDSEGTTQLLTFVTVTGGCQKTASIRGLTLRSACLRPASCVTGHHCFVTDPNVPADLNGVILKPIGGASVQADATSGELGSGQTVKGKYDPVPGQQLEASFGPFPINSNFATTIPPAGPDGDRTLAELPAVGNLTLFGFPITGGLPLTFHNNGTATIPLSVALPAPLDGVTGSVDISSTPGGGVDVQHAHVSVPPFPIGPIKFGAEVDYDKPTDLWSGQFNLGAGYDVQGGAAFTGTGEFQSANVSVDKLNLPVYPGILLQRLDVAFAANPTSISGGARFSVGPEFDLGFGPDALLTADGTVSATFPSGQPWTVQVTGAVSVAGIPFAEGALGVKSNGSAYASGRFSYDFFGHDFLRVNGAIGVIYNADSSFDGDASVNVCVKWVDCATGWMTISSIGIGACLDGGSWAPDVGGWYAWNGSHDFFWHGCDLGPIHVALASAAAGPGRAFTVPRGIRATVLKFIGAGGKQPHMTLVSPSGKRYVVGPGGGLRDDINHVILVEDPADTVARAILGTPEPGVWRAEPLPGSPAVTSIERSDETVRPRVSTFVSGHGFARQLHYSIDAPGTTVRFIERGPVDRKGVQGAFQQIAVRRGASGTAPVLMIGAAAAAAKHPRPVTGTIAFTPASGPGGRRTIYALVFRDGVFQRHLTVGSYVAPSPRTLAAPTVRFARRAGRLVFKISRVTGATGYLLGVRALDGRRERIEVAVTSRSVTITPFPDADAATVTVAAESGRGSTGRVTTIRVTPAGTPPSAGRRSGRLRRPRRR